MNLLGNAFKFVPPGGRVRCSLRQSRRELVARGRRLRPGRQAGAAAGDLRALPPGRRRHQPQGGRHRPGARDRQGIRRDAQGAASRCSTPTSAARASRSRCRCTASPPVRARRRAAAGEPRSQPMLDGRHRELRSGQRRDRQVRRARSTPAVAGRPRVLVVEDNPDMNRFVTQCLAAHYEVISAFDGREGLEKALRFRPTLVVSDIMMPNVSGVEMIAEMRKLPELQRDADPAALRQGGRRADGQAPRRGRPGLHRQAVFREGPDGPGPQPDPGAAGARGDAVAGARARRARGRAARGRERQPRQGRVPGHARPRAAQSAVADPDRAAADEAARRAEDRSASAPSSSARSSTWRGWSTTCSTSRASPAARSSSRPRVVEMAEVVAKAIEMASPLLEQRTHTLTVDVPRRGLRVDGDPTRLSQVVSNLLTNAAKYTPPGGADHDPRRAGGRRGRAARARHRHRHRARGAAARLRSVRAGAAGARSVAGRPRPRPDDRAQPGRAARRHRRRAQRRARPGQRVRRPPADRGDGRPTRAEAPERPPARSPRTPRAGGAAHPGRRRQRDAAEMLAEALGRQGLRHARRARRADGAAHRRASSRRTSPSSTSACR